MTLPITRDCHFFVISWGFFGKRGDDVGIVLWTMLASSSGSSGSSTVRQESYCQRDCFPVKSYDILNYPLTF